MISKKAPYSTLVLVYTTWTEREEDENCGLLDGLGQGRIFRG